jgi:hypothetical protein
LRQPYSYSVPIPHTVDCSKNPGLHLFYHANEPVICKCYEATVVLCMQCCGPGIFFLIPGPIFLHPGSDFFPSRIPDPRSASKNLSILTQKMVSKLLEIRSELLIPDPGSGLRLFTHPGSRIQVSKKAPDPGSGSAILSVYDKYNDAHYNMLATPHTLI